MNSQLIKDAFFTSICLHFELPPKSRHYHSIPAKCPSCHINMFEKLFTAYIFIFGDGILCESFSSNSTPYAYNLLKPQRFITFALLLHPPFWLHQGQYTPGERQIAENQRWGVILGQYHSVYGMGGSTPKLITGCNISVFRYFIKIYIKFPFGWFKW